MSGCASNALAQEPPLAEVFSTNLNPNIIRICGAVISNTFDYEGVTYQYMFNCALSYDPRRLKPVRLEPVAATFRVDIVAPTVELMPGENMVNGYIIWSEVETFLTENRLQNFDPLQLLGSPKTPQVYNQEKKRYEQYFSNMGFYRYENDPPGMLHLIPYGVMRCASECTFDASQVQEGDNAVPSLGQFGKPTGEKVVGNTDPPIFRQAVDRMKKGMPGKELGSAEKLKDGTYVKPYTNLWLCVFPSDPKKVIPCALAAWANITKAPPVKESHAPNTVFWATKPGYGYNIPEIVSDFVTLNGTREFSGDPYFEPLSLPGTDDAWMCFQSYCVVYDRITLDPTTVRFYPLGIYYYDMFKKQKVQPVATQVTKQPIATEQPSQLIPGQPIRTEVWDRFPFLQPTQQQVIGIVLHQGDQVMQGVSLRLVVTLPGEIKQTWEMKPTDGNGRSIFAMPLLQAPNGSRIIYEVCTYGLKPNDFCDQDSFTIQISP